VLEQCNLIEQLLGAGIQVGNSLIVGQSADQIDKIEVVVDDVLRRQV
jgi:hypothetical protein